MSRKFFLIFVVFLFSSFGEARLPELSPQVVNMKLDEITKAHASYKTFNPTLAKRALHNFLEELDPTKTYLMKPDIIEWLEPSEWLLDQMVQDYKKGNFQVFERIHEQMVQAVHRRHQLEKQVDFATLPKHVNPEEFKETAWAENEEELLDRLKKLKALQLEATSKLSEEFKEKSWQRITKRQAKYEEELLSWDPTEKQNFILSRVLKASAAALDTHTAYFTPAEATQFMINVQQRLFGIGAQLRDDLNGFAVMKIIEGGPASRGKELKVKDRIIAVNGEPVVGMDIIDAVELIRGEEHTPVTLTVTRETQNNEETVQEETLDIKIVRGEVVLKETRFESSYEPYGDGVIAYLKLYSFYQDPETSSAADLTREIQKLKREHNVKGVILDLRSNSGGMLSQAVAVTGLFITKGIVVSIKDDTEAIQHLRDLDGKMVWDGPLLVLVNRASASASEIVAQALQDYGRAIVIGDDHTYGKGSFQTFTLNPSRNGGVNPQGEYKVTRGRYYTVSGNTPQLTGVRSDVVVPGPLHALEIGESFAKYPLENDRIKANFDDDLEDVPFSQRAKISALYKFDLQPILKDYTQHAGTLQRNAEVRIQNNKNYQNLLKELQKKSLEEEEDPFGQDDLQLAEAYNVMKDLILLML